MSVALRCSLHPFKDVHSALLFHLFECESQDLTRSQVSQTGVLDGLSAGDVDDHIDGVIEHELDEVHLSQGVGDGLVVLGQGGDMAEIRGID